MDPLTEFTVWTNFTHFPRPSLNVFTGIFPEKIHFASHHMIGQAEANAVYDLISSKMQKQRKKKQQQQIGKENTVPLDTDRNASISMGMGVLVCVSV